MHASADDRGVVRPVSVTLVECVILPLPVPTVLLKVLKVAVDPTMKLRDVIDAFLSQERRRTLAADAGSAVK